jgi:hypothetical protein
MAMAQLQSKTQVATRILWALGALLAGLSAACNASDGDGATAPGTAAGGGSGATGGGSTVGGQGGAGAQAGGCTGSGDCANDPNGPVCDPATGACVQCLPDGTGCAEGQICDPLSVSCTLGCTTEAECTAEGYLQCDQQSHKCVLCLADDDCLPGTICTEGACVFGCKPTHDCPSGLTCCSGMCHDLANDPNNCGQCDDPCAPPANAFSACLDTVCAVACMNAFVDCNGDLADGCEWNILQDGPCTCVPGSSQPCYQGTPGTEHVGLCDGGTQICDPSGLKWGPCEGQVLPHYELCANGIDEDCNGILDDVVDRDGDGWTICNGDCCDVASPTCPSPKLVNPGAFEVLNDGIDNDCDPATSDSVAPAACSTVAKLTGVTATNVANAMELCQTTTASPPLSQRKWGLISATHYFANGVVPSTAELTSFQNSQTAIITHFGTGGVVPKSGATLGVISSGMARDAADAGWVSPISGTDFSFVGANTSITFPGAAPLGTYTGAHGGGLLAGHCGTTDCPVGTGANDSVAIRLVIRTPTNAQGFSYDFRFYSAEYYTYQCTVFNDYYLAMLTSGAPAIPADHNISFDALNNPVSVNNGFFQDCGGNPINCAACPGGTASLAGTGFDGTTRGGSTEWLTTDAPIIPGETITLDLMVFDVSDHILDTLILLDNFRWSLTPVVLGTHQ